MTSGAQRSNIAPAQVLVLPRTAEQTIPEDYLDAMGHMNVMWYTHLFSVATQNLFALVGIDHQYIESQRAGTFALEAHLRYLSEVRVGHRVSVHSRLLGRSAKRCHLMQLMVNHDKQDVSATFEAVSTHVDLSVRRSAPLPPGIAARIDALLAEHQRLEWPAPVCGVIAP